MEWLRDGTRLVLGALCGLIFLAGALFALVSFVGALWYDAWNGIDVLGYRDPNLGMLGFAAGFAVAYFAGRVAKSVLQY